MTQLADLAWPAVGVGRLLVVPLGATEQHGPHLPLSTDTDIAVALSERVAARRTDVVVAPPLPFGSSGEHAGFAGTLSIGQSAFELVVVELCRSATETFDRVLLVNAHGGNAEPLRRAISTLRNEGRDVRAWAPHWKGDPHAGQEETSLQLALDASRVHEHHHVIGDVRPLTETLAAMISGGVRAVSANGVLGDPRPASAAEGAALLADLTTDLIEVVASWPGGTSAPTALNAGAAVP